MATVRVVSAFSSGKILNAGTGRMDYAVGDVLTIGTDLSAAQAAALEAGGYVTSRPNVSDHGSAAAILAAEAASRGEALVPVQTLARFCVGADADVALRTIIDVGTGRAALWIQQGLAAPALAITLTAGAHGAVSPAGTVYKANGGSLDVTITPDEDYEIDAVLVDGVAAEIEIAEETGIGSLEFTNLGSGHVVTATFAAVPAP